MIKKSFLLVFLLPVLSQARMLDAVKLFLIVRNAQTIILERLGKYHRTLAPGINFKLPFFDAPRKVFWSYDTNEGRKYLSDNRIDLREKVYNFPRQFVITQDNVAMEITALVYYQIIDAKKAVYGVEDLPLAIESITQTTLRNIIGTMHLDETLVSRDKINSDLCKVLDVAANKWGVHITRVELQEVTPPKDICDSMARQMRAERDSRALVLQAEGNRKADILTAEGEAMSAIKKAEGEKQSAILKALGEAEARITKANAEATAIQVLQDKTGGKAIEFLLGQAYIEAFAKLAESDNKILVPYDQASLANPAVIISEVLNNKKSK